MARSAALALTDHECLVLVIEVAHREGAQFAVATTGKQGRTNEGPEYRIAGVEESEGFFTGQKADDRRFDVVESGYTPPGVV